MSYGDLHTGYGCAQLGYMRALNAVGVQVAPLSFKATGQITPTPFLSNGFDSYTGAAWNPDWPTILHLRPSHMEVGIAEAPSRLAAGITVVEGSAVPREYAEACNKLPVLVVPSWFVANVFGASGHTGSREIVPHAVEVPPSLRVDQPPKDQCTFLHVGTWTSRKGGDIALKAYQAAFPEGHYEGCPTLLMIKVSSELEAQTAKNLAGTHPAQVYILHDFLSEDMAWRLFQYADGYLSTHRGEGFGLGALQARLLGMPVVYTNWSAPAEFCSEANDYPLPYTLEAPSADYALMLPEYREPSLVWALPKFDEAVAAIQKVAARRHLRSLFPELGLARRFSYTTVGQDLQAILSTHA